MSLALFSGASGTFCDIVVHETTPVHSHLPSQSFLRDDQLLLDQLPLYRYPLPVYGCPLPARPSGGTSVALAYLILKSVLQNWCYWPCFPDNERKTQKFVPFSHGPGSRQTWAVNPGLINFATVAVVPRGPLCRCPGEQQSLSKQHYPCFMDKKKEAERGETPCPRLTDCRCLGQVPGPPAPKGRPAALMLSVAISPTQGFTYCSVTTLIHEDPLDCEIPENLLFQLIKVLQAQNVFLITSSFLHA